jgi:hypothetical protein
VNYADKSKMINFFERNVRMVNTNHGVVGITFTYEKGRSPEMSFKVVTKNSSDLSDKEEK